MAVYNFIFVNTVGTAQLFCSMHLRFSYEFLTRWLKSLSNVQMFFTSYDILVSNIVVPENGQDR